MTARPGLAFEFSAMASPCEIKVAALAEKRANAAAKAAIDEVRRIERKYSRYLPDSVITRINNAAGVAPLSVDDETAALLDYAGVLFEQSGGLFDATSGILRRAWDFKQGRIPEDDALAALVALVGWQRVWWRNGRFLLPEKGMELDFGGFGKEYAADRAAAVLAKHGVTSGLVNLGGDIRVLGPQPDGSPWWLAVQHPRDPARVAAQIPLMSGALTTSGDYERFFIQDGRRYCHILNPRTGWPVTAWQSISIVSPLASSAGSLATIGMLMEARATEFLEAQQAAYMMIDMQGAVHLKHWRGDLQPRL
jgi:FAD:protein FMN transferase